MYVFREIAYYIWSKIFSRKGHRHYLLFLVLFAALIFGVRYISSHPFTQSIETTKASTIVNYGSVSDKTPSSSLANSVLTSGIKSYLQKQGIKTIAFDNDGSFVLNNDKSNLNASISSAPYVQLAGVNSIGQVGAANAWLNNSSRQYLTREQTNNAETIQPKGWNQLKIGGLYSYLYNRGHLIGYAIAGKVKGFDASEANANNIVTQTAWANQAEDADSQGQNYWEELVRKGLDQHKLIRYRVQPLYSGTELVPRLVWLQAKSSDGSVDFNVLVPNVEPGVSINYQTGVAVLK